jgi:hypothetical protein
LGTSGIGGGSPAGMGGAVAAGTVAAEGTVLQGVQQGAQHGAGEQHMVGAHTGRYVTTGVY